MTTRLPDHDLLTPKEVARYFRLSVSSVYRLIDLGDLAAIKITSSATNGALRVLRTSVLKKVAQVWED